MHEINQLIRMPTGSGRSINNLALIKQKSQLEFIRKEVFNGTNLGTKPNTACAYPLEDAE